MELQPSAAIVAHAHEKLQSVVIAEVEGEKDGAAVEDRDEEKEKEDGKAKKDNTKEDVLKKKRVYARHVMVCIFQ